MSSCILNYVLYLMTCNPLQITAITHAATPEKLGSKAAVNRIHGYSALMAHTYSRTVQFLFDANNSSQGPTIAGGDIVIYKCRYA